MEISWIARTRAWRRQIEQGQEIAPIHTRKHSLSAGVTQSRESPERAPACVDISWTVIRERQELLRGWHDFLRAGGRICSRLDRCVQATCGCGVIRHGAKLRFVVGESCALPVRPSAFFADLVPALDSKPARAIGAKSPASTSYYDSIFDVRQVTAMAATRLRACTVETLKKMQP